MRRPTPDCRFLDLAPSLVTGLGHGDPAPEAFLKDRQGPTGLVDWSSVVVGVWVGFDQPRTILPNGFAADVAVPLWANFMKVATRGDKPEWLTPPPGVTSATVCRLSGKLATDACRNTYVENSDGSLSQRTMAYTDYFARGTAPAEYCDMHASQGILTRIAGVFGIESKPAPHVEPAGVQVAAPPAPVFPNAAPAPPQVEPEPPPPPTKKRGFWGRLFGRGEPEKSEKPKKPRD